MSRIEGSVKNMRLERTISIAVLCALLGTFVYTLFTWDPASAQSSGTTITVDAPPKILGISEAPTEFDPNPASAPSGSIVTFKLADGSESATIEVQSPPDGFAPPTCILTAGKECQVVLKPGYVGEITYMDASNTFVDPGEGVIDATGASPSPSGSASPTASASASPSASPSTSPSPTASPSASPSPSPTSSPTPGPTIHERFLSLDLKKKLIASGEMQSDDPGCVIGAPVDIGRKKKGKFRRVTRTFTNGQGEYKIKLPNKSGKYRAKSPRFSSPDGSQVCAKVNSNVVRYRK